MGPPIRLNPQELVVPDLTNILGPRPLVVPDLSGIIPEEDETLDRTAWESAVTWATGIRDAVPGMIQAVREDFTAIFTGGPPTLLELRRRIEAESARLAANRNTTGFAPDDPRRFGRDYIEARHRQDYSLAQLGEMYERTLALENYRRDRRTSFNRAARALEEARTQASLDVFSPDPAARRRSFELRTGVVEDEFSPGVASSVADFERQRRQQQVEDEVLLGTDPVRGMLRHLARFEENEDMNPGDTSYDATMKRTFNFLSSMTLVMPLLIDSWAPRRERVLPEGITPAELQEQIAYQVGSFTGMALLLGTPFARGITRKPTTRRAASAEVEAAISAQVQSANIGTQSRTTQLRNELGLPSNTLDNSPRLIDFALDRNIQANLPRERLLALVSPESRARPLRELVRTEGILTRQAEWRAGLERMERRLAEVLLDNEVPPAPSLDGSVVRSADGELLRAFHGTPEAFAPEPGQVVGLPDPAKSSRGVWPVNGTFFATALRAIGNTADQIVNIGKVVSGYAGKRLALSDVPSVSVEQRLNTIKGLESRIKEFVRLSDEAILGLNKDSPLVKGRDVDVGYNPSLRNFLEDLGTRDPQVIRDEVLKILNIELAFNRSQIPAPNVHATYIDIRNPFMMEGEITPDMIARTRAWLDKYVRRADVKFENGKTAAEVFDDAFLDLIIREAREESAERSLKGRGIPHPEGEAFVQTVLDELARALELVEHTSGKPRTDALGDPIYSAPHEILQQMGYDGLHYIGGIRGGGTAHPYDAWVVFDQKQIHPYYRSQPKVRVVSGVYNPRAVTAAAVSRGFETAVHYRANGVSDVLIFDKSHPLAKSKDLRTQFEREGHFASERVTVDGKSGIYLAKVATRSNKPLVKVAIDTADGLKAITVNRNRVRRNPITQGVQELGEGAKTIYKTFRARFDDVAINGTEDGLEGAIRKFAEGANLDPATITPFMRQQYASEIRTRILAENNVGQGVNIDAHMLQFVQDSPLEVSARTGGFEAKYWPNGAVEIRNTKGHLIDVFRTADEAMEFLSNIEQQVGVDFTPGLAGELGRGVMPPGSGRPPRTNEPLHPEAMRPFSGQEGGYMSKFFDSIVAVAPILANAERWLAAIDNLRGTSFSNKYRELVSAKLRLDARVKNFLDRHEAQITALSKGLTEREMENITRYRQTASAAELTAGMMRRGHRSSVVIAKELADLTLDTGKILGFTRKLREAEIEFVRNPKKFAERVRELYDIYDIKTLDELAAVSMLDAVRKVNVKRMPLWEIIELTDALILEKHGLDMTRAEYARSQNMSPKSLALAHMLDSVYKDLAVEFKIPDWKILERYAARYATQPDPKGPDSIRAFLNQPGLGGIKEVKFINNMIRSGEVNAYQMNPIKSLVRYIRAGFLEVELAPIIKATKLDWGRQYANTDRYTAGWVRLVGEHLVNHNIAGTLSQDLGFLRSMISEFRRVTGIKIKDEAVETLTFALLGNASGATQGYRVAMAARDFTSAMLPLMSELPTSRVGRILDLGFNDKNVKITHQQGVTPPPLSPIEFAPPGDLKLTGMTSAAQISWRFSRWVSDNGLKLSGQGYVYDRLQTGLYLEGVEHATRVLNDLARGRIKPKRGMSQIDTAYEMLNMDLFQPAFRRQFDSIFKLDDISGAAHLYGQQMGRQYLPSYGRANLPVLWGSLFGRIYTQFGRYPIWAVETMARMSSMGSHTRRAENLTRFALANAFLKQTGDVLGVDVYNWMFHTGVFWNGGIAVEFFDTLGEMAYRERGVMAAVFGDYGLVDRLVPDSDNLRSVMVPGSYAAYDFFSALRGLRTGELTMPQVIGRAAGTQTKAPQPVGDALLDLIPFSNWVR